MLKGSGGFTGRTPTDWSWPGRQRRKAGRSSADAPEMSPGVAGKQVLGLELPVDLELVGRAKELGAGSLRVVSGPPGPRRVCLLGYALDEGVTANKVTAFSDEG